MADIIYQTRIYRTDLQANPHYLYVFGDNTTRTGLGGQAAECRGEPNAHGIATLWAPGQPFEDKDYDRAIIAVNRDIWSLEMRAKGRTAVVFPYDGIGTGLASMQEHAPNVFDFMCGQLLQTLGIRNNMRQYVLAQEELARARSRKKEEPASKSS